MGETEKPSGLRMRMSVRELDKPENAKKKNAFLRAWKIIQELPPDNPNSFWAIGGYHGEPFKVSMKQPGENDQNWWGGWCQHANVLFPTWHRFYLLRLEQALRTVCPNDDIAMVYWDATSEENKNGLPDMLTQEKIHIDGKLVDNPLASFTLPVAIGGDKADEFYNKPKGYKTVRYPFSGIRSPNQAAKQAMEQTEKVESYCHEKNSTPTGLLNENLNIWLKGPEPRSGPNTRSVLYKFKACLSTASYSCFSNTTSSDKLMPKKPTASLESPHNDLHLAIGGFSLPDVDFEAGVIKGANGDMGENETAALDPIFFFHHCNIDRVFWIWQKKHGRTKDFELDPNDMWGTNATEPTAGQSLNQKLSMDTILHPFQHPNGVPVTSRDCIDIHELGYDYTIGSLDQEIWPEYIKSAPKFIEAKSEDDIQYENDSDQSYVYDVTNVSHFQWNPSGSDTFFVRITGINRDMYPGSKLLRLYYRIPKPANFIGQASILSRWNPELCDNCKHHRKFGAWFNLQYTPIVYDWPPKASDFIATIVYFDPLAGEYKENPVPTELESDETEKEEEKRKAQMSYFLAIGPQGKTFYNFMQRIPEQ